MKAQRNLLPSTATAQRRFLNRRKTDCLGLRLPRFQACLGPVPTASIASLTRSRYSWGRRILVYRYDIMYRTHPCIHHRHECDPFGLATADAEVQVPGDAASSIREHAKLRLSDAMKAADYRSGWCCGPGVTCQCSKLGLLGVVDQL